MSFERIKIDHFEKLPYTKRQLTDFYNTAHNTNYSQENLVFVQSGCFQVNPVTIDLTANSKHFYVIHNAYASHDFRGNFDLNLYSNHMRSSDNFANQITNFVGTKITRTQGTCTLFLSVFTFA